MSNVIVLPGRVVRPVPEDGEAKRERYRAVMIGLTSDLESVVAALERMRRAMLAEAERRIGRRTPD